MKNMRRIASIALTALVLFAVITSLLIVAHEADHDCTGEDCRICAIIAVCENTIKTISDFMFAHLSVFAFLCAVLFILLILSADTNRNTPVTNKVKLLN